MEMDSEMEHGKKKGKMMIMISMLLWMIGFVMVLGAFYIEFLGPLATVPDSTSSKLLMTMKLGGIGFILSGIYMTLVVIAKALMMMPKMLGAVIGKK